MNYADWTEQELIELWEERAAIMQHDAGMSKRAADRAAYWDWRAIVGRDVAVPQEIQEKVTLFRDMKDGAE